MKKKLLTIILLSASIWAGAESASEPLMLNLKNCREMALQQSNEAKITDEAKAAAELNRKAALAAMFPKFSANASYIYNNLDICLMPDQKEFTFGQYSTAEDGSHSFNFTDEWWAANSPTADLQIDPSQFGSVGQAIIAPINQQFANMDSRMRATLEEYFNTIYNDLRNELSFDNHNYFVAQVGVVQPIYVGGRLMEAYHMAQSAERIAGMQGESKKTDLVVSVDEAYWRVVSVQHKKELADTYYDLLVKLEGDVEVLVESGLATQSDLLKVKAKRGEAEVKKLQASNGLVLSKMALCQLCGLPLMQDVVLDDSGISDIRLHTGTFDATEYTNGRHEIQLLEEAEKMAKSSVKIAAAGLQPNIMASANYVYTNPNMENGLKTDWSGKGFFTAGVVVNIPIAHADDILRYKASKHAANVATLKLEEAREMIQLQATQANQKVMEANQKIQMSQMALHNAEEVLRLATESFDAGMVTSGDVLQAQTAWLSAGSDLIDAEVEAQVAETYFQKYTNSLEY